MVVLEALQLPWTASSLQQLTILLPRGLSTPIGGSQWLSRWRPVRSTDSLHTFRRESYPTWRKRTSKNQSNTPLQPRRWDGASSQDRWVVTSPHQRPLLLEPVIKHRIRHGRPSDRNLFAGVTGLFLFNKNTIGLAVGLLSLVLREASEGRSGQEIIVEGQIGTKDRCSTKCILRMSVCRSLLSPASQETGLNT